MAAAAGSGSSEETPAGAAPASSSRRGCGLWALGLYLILLLASHLVCQFSAPVVPGEAELAAAGRQGVWVHASTGEVRLAYREWDVRRPEAPVLVLLHGSPGSADDFRRLGPELGRSFRVLAPDLPGFGLSSREVPEYSIAAHAAYVEAWLAQLGIEDYHLLGFSMGGGVALELVGQQGADAAGRASAPRARSLTLVSALGVQELELLGSYPLNHAVHGLQLGALRFLYEGVPHFGWLDGGPLSIPYARNFFDTDQRPLRAILQSLEMPLLILHGEKDFLVPVEVARESQRLAPQAEAVFFDDGHFMVFAGGERLARPIVGFVEGVEAGRGRTRADTSPEARARAQEALDTGATPRASGVTLLVLFLVLAASTLVSEDLTCIAAGVLVAQGRIDFLPAALACISGIFLGDVLLYGAGRLLGRPWLARAPLKWWIKPAALERGERWFREKGPGVIFLSRFTPGTRLATYVAAGLLRAGFLRFAFWFLLAAALWTPLLVYLASVLGARVFLIFDVFSRYALPGLVGLVALLWLLLKAVPPLFTWKGRRRALGWWRRKTRWEFWPPWLFYPPLIAYVLALAVKHRSLTLFTAANPAIPAGGFLGESKGEILDGLPQGLDASGEAAPIAVAPYRLIPPGRLSERQDEVRRFLADRGLGLPVVLKPDRGQRGAGVRVARDWESVEAALVDQEDELLAQQYIPGVELGVFYIRQPGAERGRIFSITHKILPEVVGDGRRSLEELVLADDRAVVLSRLYLENLEARRGWRPADDIPTAGERVVLTDLGTHCRGAIFLDGWEKAWSEELEAAVDRFSRGYEGFYFGRYDLRAPSFEAIRAGRELRVLELNGVTSEATHLYDPKNSLIDAYRILFEQWRLAFEIGRESRERGAEITPLRQLLDTIPFRR